MSKKLYLAGRVLPKVIKSMEHWMVGVRWEKLQNTF